MADKTLTLPSGKTAAIREGTGADLMRAHEHLELMGEKKAAGVKTLWLLIADLATIDGQAIVYEDLAAMKLADVAVLEREMYGDFL